MSERFSLDRQSFEQFLSAASVLQQLEKRCLPLTRDNTQPLAELVEAQQAIEVGTLDLRSAIDRITELALKLTDARGAAVWLFTQAEFVYSGGAGSASKDHRLKMQVLSRLASTSRLSDDALCEPEDPHLAESTGNYPSVARSLLVAPVYQGRNIAGALAAFSDEPAAFLDQDTTNIRLLAGLVAYALDKDAEIHLKESVSVERATMLKVIEQLAPSLEKLALERERERERSTQPPSAELEKKTQEADSNFPPELAAAQPMNEPEDEWADEPGFAHPVAAPVVQPEKRVPQWILDSTKKVVPELPELPPLGETSSVEAPMIDLATQPIASLIQAEPPQFEFEPSFVADSFEPLPVEDPIAAELMTQAWFGETEWSATEAPAEAPVGEHPVVAATESLSPAELMVAPVAEQQLVVMPNIGSIPVANEGRVSAEVAIAPTNEAQALPAHAAANVPVLVEKSERVVQPSGVAPSILGSGSPAPAIPAVIPIQFSAEFWNRRQQREHEMMAGLTMMASKRLRVAQSSVNHAVDNARTQARAVAKYRINLLIGRKASELRGIRRATGASLVLLIMLAFVIFEIGMRTPSQTASASSAPISKRALSPPSGGSNGVHAESARTTPASGTIVSATAHASPGSHLRITDPDAAEEVAELSQYEVSRLLQQAAKGDDWSAFQLGMAYETGQGLTQSCAKAAQWVSRAAGMGNIAAEYNLGLRYRDGDGLATNPEEAQKWLAKAAKSKYPGAQAALATVPTIPVQASAAQPRAQP
jgi:hypothetical protein